MHSLISITWPNKTPCEDNRKVLKNFEFDLFKQLIHKADPHSWWVVITIFTHIVRPFFSLNKKKSSEKWRANGPGRLDHWRHLSCNFLPFLRPPYDVFWTSFSFLSRSLPHLSLKHKRPRNILYLIKYIIPYCIKNGFSYRVCPQPRFGRGLQWQSLPTA